MAEPPFSEEVVDALPVLAAPAGIERARPAVVPVRQAAAIAASSFVAGAATVAVVTRRRTRPRGVRAVRGRRRRDKGVLGDVVASNSFLIDVHLLRRG